MGVKHLFELVPSGLKKRIKQDRRKLWDEQQALTVAEAWADLSKHCKSPKSSSKAADSKQVASAEAKDSAEAKGSTETNDFTEAKDSAAAESEDADNASEETQKVLSKLTKEELQSRVDLLKELNEKYEDPGVLAFMVYLSLAALQGVPMRITENVIRDSAAIDIWKFQTSASTYCALGCRVCVTWGCSGCAVHHAHCACHSAYLATTRQHVTECHTLFDTNIVSGTFETTNCQVHL